MLICVIRPLNDVQWQSDLLSGAEVKGIEKRYSDSWTVPLH